MIPELLLPNQEMHMTPDSLSIRGIKKHRSMKMESGWLALNTYKTVMLSIVLFVVLLFTFSSVMTSSARSKHLRTMAPGNVTARARATFSTTTTETFTLTAEVFSGSIDCTSGGGSPTTINNVGQSGYTLALGPTDSVLFTAAHLSDQSNEVVVADLSGRFVDWLVPAGQVGGITVPPGSDGTKICVQGVDSPNAREVDANYAPAIQLRDSTCTTQLTAFHPGDTVCLMVFGGLDDAPAPLHYFGDGGTSPTNTSCTFLPIPPAYTPVPITADPSTFLFTFPASNAAIPAACNTTDIRGPWRVGVLSPDNNGARAIKTFELTDPTCNLSCPADISVPNDPDQCGANVTYTTPSGANCGTVTCNHPSGSFFPVGTTNVTCTSTAGPTCSFDVTVNDTQDPTITCPGDMTVDAAAGTCAAVVNFTVTAGDNCSASTIVSSPPSGSSFPLGTTTVVSTATDATGNSKSCSFTVTVKDAEAPIINTNGQTVTLWSPNHSYATINVSDLITSASDLCDPTVNLSSVVIATVTSDEANNSGGDGNTTNDIVIAPNCKSVQLRSERSGSGNGRVYIITFKVTDASGNVATATGTVIVPKSQNGTPAINDGPSYLVLSSCP
jgi:hypothetical protein